MWRRARVRVSTYKGVSSVVSANWKRRFWESAPPPRREAPHLLLLLGGPLTNPQSTLICWPIRSWPFRPSMAACASLYVSYSTSA
ncbi:hypothetical protein JZ751_004343 [Albula glossodonta]|uniref:Uncharacterized protein n=1 Tax=Albula glossodonta TaxID=121402 RepID=A0A8T2N8H1_9TELE|nr:hypothetical protein JZ751_004343 [Albula glossodonta]